FLQQTYMEKPQIKMGYGFTADFQPPAVEAKTITHFNCVTLFKCFSIKKALLRTQFTIAT
ncbi:hypothetical protein, partial [Pedobacter antarcticus]|uniref:hypothetical protein n=1 Tax=Pedobacter antarcticus TaxID=34086 RepID=UPI001F369440